MHSTTPHRLEKAHELHHRTDGNKKFSQEQTHKEVPSNDARFSVHGQVIVVVRQEAQKSCFHRALRSTLHVLYPQVLSLLRTQLK